MQNVRICIELSVIFVSFNDFFSKKKTRKKVLADDNYVIDGNIFVDKKIHSIVVYEGTITIL
jgi:hypothetical protein